MSEFYESRPWLDLRYRVLQKSGGVCKLCGCRASADNPIQVDHIKPRSLHPELELAESNMQVLCKNCNQGKSNKDDTDWRVMPSRELTQTLTRKTAILAHATAEQKAKLEQLSWLKNNDMDKHIKVAAEKEYRELWRLVEADWIARGSL